MGYSLWDSNTKKTDKSFFWVGFKDACNIARWGWPGPWMDEEMVECVLDRRTKQKAGQIPGDVLGISCPLEGMKFYLYYIP